MDWYPALGEDLHLRTLASFATDTAAPVAGLRSFRAPDRRDIEPDLEGWPPRPAFAPHGRASKAAGTAVGAAAWGIPALANLAYGLLGGQGRGASVPEGVPGEPEEPENEVEDFPVVWAAPGTIGRRLAGATGAELWWGAADSWRKVVRVVCQAWGWSQGRRWPASGISA
jgi:hypothetical protein